MALTASSASMPSDARKAKLRKLFAFRVRTAAPASLRSSTEENCLAFPPPTSNSRLAFSLAGLCKSVVSKFLPVTSPLAITSAAASCTALSLVAAKASVFSFSPRSRTTATRHSVSTSAGVEKERFVFMLCRTVSLGDVQIRKRSAEHESPSPRRSACQARMASATPHCVFSPPNLFDAVFDKFLPFSELDRKSTRLNSSHSQISYAVFCLKKKKKKTHRHLVNHHRDHTTARLCVSDIQL